MAFDKIQELPNRRPLAARRHPFFASAAQFLMRCGVTPNAVSLASIACGAAAGACYVASAHFQGWAPIALLIAAPAMIGLRGICNVLDGMIAVEGGMKSPSGEIYNDFPDRVSDLLMLIGAGYAVSPFAWGAELGWLAAAMAVMTAYTRVLGGCTGAKQYFIGPMAKTHRMALLSAASLFAAVEFALRQSTWSLMVALSLVVIGCLVTIARRLSRIVQELEKR